jgi:16S rRNA (cytosine1402-N4)-methyltransferase
MLAEVLQALSPRATDTVVDGTFGLGGHGLALLHHVDQGCVLGIERDPWILDQARERAAREAPEEHRRLTLRGGSFADLDAILDAADLRGLDVGLLDLGVNSIQIDEAARGFHRDDPSLDLRYDPDDPMTVDAATFLATAPPTEIADVLHRLGGERLARPITRAIVRRRDRGNPVDSATELAALVAGVYHRRGIRRQRIHPVTRTVQALRLRVNDELDHLARGLTAFLRRLNPGGRFAALTFHSGEARIVKRAFTAAVKGDDEQLPEGAIYERITSGVLKPSREEVRRNPRARSAQLRAVRRAA